MSDHPQRASHLVRLDRLQPYLQWLLARYSLERATWIVQRLTTHVQQVGARGLVAVASTIVDSDPGNPDGPVDPVDDEQLCGVAIAIRQPGGAATLLGIQLNPEVAPHELLQPLTQELKRSGVSFLQSGCDDDGQARVLLAAGFARLADLSLMTLQSDQFGQADAAAEQQAAQTAADSIAWVTLDRLGDRWRSMLTAVAGQTFVDTLDCPRLSDYRSSDAIVQSYVEAPTFDQRLASLLRVGQRDAGCLILTAHSPHGSGDPEPTSAQAPAIQTVTMEITYMGLVPGFRGKRLAGHLIRRAIDQSVAYGAGRIVLAVDHQNGPAVSIYRRLGWRDVLVESVWGMKI